MIIKKMLLPTIKKKIVLFMAMIFVIIIGSFIMSGFTNYYFSFKNNIYKYIDDYGYPDITLNVSSGFTDTLEDIKIDGVEKITPRLNINGGILYNYSPTIVRMISTPEDSFLNYYVIEEVEASTDFLNICVDFVYAKNNDLKVGTKILLYNSLSSEDTVTVYVQKLVGSPETIYPMIQYGYPADKYNFGYVFAKEQDLRKISKYKTTPYKEIVVKTKEGADLNLIESQLKTKLEEKGINVDYSYIKSDAMPILYVNKIVNYMFTASIIVPIIFSGIIILLVFLFLHQICKSMTKELGILNSLGVSKKNIFLLLFSFSGLVGLLGGIIGSVSGYGLSVIMYNLCKNAFAMPYGSCYFNVPVIILVLTLIIFVCLLASLFTIFTIRKLSPKDAMNNNMNNNKPLPKNLDKLTRKTFGLNLAINSMHKNKTKFVISLLAVIFGYASAYGAIAYEESIKYYSNEIKQIINYDAQVYVLDQNKKDEVKTVLENQLGGNVYKYEEEYLSSVNITFNNKQLDTNICAIKKDTELINIPGNIKLEDNTIVLESTYASALGVGVNQTVTVTINGVSKDLKVANISNICREKYNYITLDTYKNTFSAEDYGYCSYLVNFKYRNILSFSLIKIDAVPLFTKEYLESYTAGPDLTLLTAKICLVIALLISFMAICIMSQSSLLEQKRKFCTLSTLGLSRNKIFTISISEMATYLILGLIIGLPSGLLLNYVLVKISSTSSLTLLFMNPSWIFFVSISIIVATLILNLFIEWLSIRKWNIALETKNRE